MTLKKHNIITKMQQLEFIFKLNFWKRILQSLHRVSQVLQNKDVNFKTCRSVWIISWPTVYFLRWIWKILSNWKDYKAAQTEMYQKESTQWQMYWNYIRVPERNFILPPFKQFLTNLKLRWDIQRNIRFFSKWYAT